MNLLTKSASLFKFFKYINNEQLLPLCYHCTLLQNRKISSKSKPAVKQRKSSVSKELSDLRQTVPLSFKFDDSNQEEVGHVDGLAISKNGRSLIFPLAKYNEQNPSKCTPKSDSTSASISKILKDTMPRERMFILKRWENKMIKELGVEGFQSYKQEVFSTGHEFHQCIQNYLPSGKLADAIPDSIQGYWTSVKPVLLDVTDVKLLEENVQHPYLNYHGIVDCVAKLRNKLCVIDWKTSRKKKSSLKQTYDYPLQTAAYAGGINFTEGTQEQITNVAIIVAYEDGSTADVHLLEADLTNFYWTKWLHRLQEYKESLQSVEP